MPLNMKTLKEEGGSIMLDTNKYLAIVAWGPHRGCWSVAPNGRLVKNALEITYRTPRLQNYQFWSKGERELCKQITDRRTRDENKKRRAVARAISDALSKVPEWALKYVRKLGPIQGNGRWIKERYTRVPGPPERRRRMNEDGEYENTLVYPEIRTPGHYTNRGFPYAITDSWLLDYMWATGEEGLKLLKWDFEYMKALTELATKNGRLHMMKWITKVKRKEAIRRIFPKLTGQGRNELIRCLNIINDLNYDSRKPTDAEDIVTITFSTSRYGHVTKLPGILVWGRSQRQYPCGSQWGSYCLRMPLLKEHVDWACNFLDCPEAEGSDRLHVIYDLFRLIDNMNLPRLKDEVVRFTSFARVKEYHDRLDQLQREQVEAERRAQQAQHQRDMAAWAAQNPELVADLGLERAYMRHAYTHMPQETPKEYPKQPFAAPEWMSYLDSAEKFVNEGLEMRHCIGSYMGDGAMGHHSFWSINYEGERASLMLHNKSRTITQLYGPCNQHVSDKLNKAVSEWLLSLVSEIEEELVAK